MDVWQQTNIDAIHRLILWMVMSTVPAVSMKANVQSMVMIYLLY